jgi:16S rRNA (guanine966-N2)-methyltransferase
VIAGSYRGLRLATLPGFDLRPTSDRVRESLFGILGDRVRQAQVVDCFAGTGALGIEALSRGATRALFVERDPKVAGLLRDNLARLPAAAAAAVTVADALQAEFWARGDFPADLVFADPPYRQDLGNRFLAALAEARQVGPQALVVLEHEGDAAPGHPEWSAVDRRRYGDTGLSFYTRHAPGRNEVRA